MKKKTQLWRGVVLALAVAGCGTGEAEEAPTIQTTEVERGDLRITAEATGSVEPILELEVKSKASGEILRLHVDVGDEVEVGTLLAEIDPRDVQNTYNQRVADLGVARTRRDMSETQLERSVQLHEQGFITDEELENARLDLANQEANLIKAEQSKNLAELQLADVTIRAPKAGTILERPVEEGSVIQSASQNVSGGTTLFVMATLSQMQVRTNVDETDMGSLQPGMTTQVVVEAYPDRVFPGVVEKIEPKAVVQQNVTMFPVIISLDNSSGLLKPGMNAEVEILIDQANGVLLVPNNAVVDIADVGPAAMVLGLDIDELELASFRNGGRFGGAIPTNGGSQQASSDSTGGAAGGTAGDAMARIAELRAKVESGEITQDSMRAAIRAAMPEGGFSGRSGQSGGRSPRGQRSSTDRGASAGSSAAGAMGAMGAMSGAEEAPAAPTGMLGPQRRTTRAVLFVMNDQGLPEPRQVELGLNDWDRTQIVAGVEEGEQVALIGAAQLMAQQQEFLERIRDRGGSNPFGGGMGGMGRGRR